MFRYCICFSEIRNFKSEPPYLPHRTILMATFFKSRRRIVALISLTALAILLVLVILPSLRPPTDLDGGPTHRLAAKLRGIIQACVVFSSDNGEHFPPHLATLVFN